MTILNITGLVLAAAMAANAGAASAKAEIRPATENYREGRSVYFTYTGEEPSEWKASTRGKLILVTRKGDKAIYRFDYETEVDLITLRALDQSGQKMAESRIELL